MFRMFRKILMAFGLMMPIVSTGAASAQAVGPANFPADGHYQVTTPSGLQYTDVKVGTGATPQTGQQVTVHYAGYLTDGKKFDASKDHGSPFTFTIGEGQVIKGWDEGVMGMKVGGERLLRIPSDLGYGARGAGGAIPPNATLLFEVELLGVE